MDYPEVVKSITEGTAGITWAVLQFTDDPKLKKLQEDSNLTEFFDSLDDADPYELRELPPVGGKRQYLVMAKTMDLPFMEDGITKKQGNDEVVRALAREQLAIYGEQYPWTKDMIQAGLEKARHANCHSCVEKRLVQEVAQAVQDHESKGGYPIGDVLLPAIDEHIDSLAEARRQPDVRDIKIMSLESMPDDYKLPDHAVQLSEDSWLISDPPEKAEPAALASSAAVEQVESDDIWGAREPCPMCTLKHLGQAIVLLNESLTGYPLHRWIAVGHLAEAEAEAPTHDIANRIRGKRIQAMDDVDYIPYLTDILAEVDAIVRL